MSENLTADVLSAKANKFLSLAWVHAMHAYVRTVKGLNAPKQPPDKEGMTNKNRHGDTLLTVAELVKRALGNADRWDPLLDQMCDVARPIKEYAIASNATIDVIYLRSREELAPKAWEKLSAAQQAELKAEFGTMVNDLMDIAKSNQAKAQEIKDLLRDYQRLITADHDESGDIQLKYKSWMTEEDKTLAIWEKDHGLKPGETDELIDRLQKDVADFNARWAAATTGSIALAGGTVAFGMVLFPPLGVIAGLIGMSLSAAEAARLKQQMDEFSGRLTRVLKYNEVKVFFKVMDGQLAAIMKATEEAVAALGEVEGLWAKIINDLKSIQGSSGLSTVAGKNGWEAPMSLVRKMGQKKFFENLERDCDVFVQFAYVKDIRSIPAGKK